MKGLLVITLGSLLLLSGCASTSPQNAKPMVDEEPLIMVRSAKPFSATLEQLTTAINFNEYKISRIQRVDVGLTKSGYKTKQYRVVFYGKPSEIDKLAKDYPNLIPFLPLKIVIFAEGDNTILLALNPYELRKLVPEKDLVPYYREWETDVRNILTEARE
ncbi:MAG: DUF302 domain-containing protein [Acidiferrobacterales bacterium]